MVNTWACVSKEVVVVFLGGTQCRRNYAYQSVMVCTSPSSGANAYAQPLHGLSCLVLEGGASSYANQYLKETPWASDSDLREGSAKVDGDYNWEIVRVKVGYSHGG